jgi:hypothetical protein
MNSLAIRPRRLSALTARKQFASSPLCRMINGGYPRPSPLGFRAGHHSSQVVKPIEHVVVGDLVWAWDNSAGRLVQRRIRRLFRHKGKAILRVLFNRADVEEAIDATTEHPFWVEGKGWVSAGELKPNDVLKRIDRGEPVRVRCVTDLRRTADVFNFEVDGVHNYFVGREGVLVHNASRKPSLGDRVRQLRGDFGLTVSKYELMVTLGVRVPNQVNHNAHLANPDIPAQEGQGSQTRKLDDARYGQSIIDNDLLDNHRPTLAAGGPPPPPGLRIRVPDWRGWSNNASGIASGTWTTVAASSLVYPSPRSVRAAIGTDGGNPKAVSGIANAGEVAMRPGAHDMPIPFSKERSNDPVLRALEEGQPLGMSKPVALSEMPSIPQFARISEIHGSEFALTQDALYGRPHIVQGGVNQVGVPSLHTLLAHTHLDERFVRGDWWTPSQGDVELIRSNGQRSSVIVAVADGRADTFYDLLYGSRP